MPLIIALWCVAPLFGTACLGVTISQIAEGGGRHHLQPARLWRSASSTSLALPWRPRLPTSWAAPPRCRLPAHAAVRPALAAGRISAWTCWQRFFLAVVDLAGAGGRLPVRHRSHGRHEAAPERVLLPYPAFPRRHEPHRARRRCLHFPGVVEVHARCRLGRWSWPTTASATMYTPAIVYLVDGELRHALLHCSRPTACWPDSDGTAPSRPSGLRLPRPASLAAVLILASSGRLPDRRPAWCRCMSG